MGKKESIIKELSSFAKEISRDYPLQKMIFFGSRAKGKFRFDSDVDLIIVSKAFQNQNWLNRSPKLYLRWNLDYPVDFLCYTPTEFNRKKKKIGIIRTAMAEGIEIKAE